MTTGIIHFIMRLDEANTITDSAEELLQPYVTKLLQLCAMQTSDAPFSEPRFRAFYIEGASSPRTVLPETANEQGGLVLVTPSAPSLLTDSADAAAVVGEGLFWAAVRSLRHKGVNRG
jgi:hypothetical protein